MQFAATPKDNQSSLTKDRQNLHANCQHLRLPCGTCPMPLANVSDINTEPSPADRPEAPTTDLLEPLSAFLAKPATRINDTEEATKHTSQRWWQLSRTLHLTNSCITKHMFREKRHTHARTFCSIANGRAGSDSFDAVALSSLAKSDRSLTAAQW
jgi:hypothetical protein